MAGRGLEPCRELGSRAVSRARRSGSATADRWLPSYPWRFVHLAALWGYGVSQPVFAMLVDNPEFLVINGASRPEAVAFAVALAFGPPLAAVGLQALLGVVSSRAAGVSHLFCVWLFGCTALLQVLSLFEPTSQASLLVPAAGAFGGLIAYTRWRPIRSFLSVSIALPLVGLVTFLATAPLALADSEGADVEVAADTPVVLLVFDELPLSSLMRRDGSIDSRRYPGFGRLARGGTWYSRATTLHEYTTRAVPAILTGSAPRSGTLPTLADHPYNLFTLLGESYAFRVQEPVTRLCPVTYCPNHRSDRSLASRVGGLLHAVGINYLHGSLPSDLHGNISPLVEGWGALVRNTARGTDEFKATVRRSNPARTLYFLHAMQPHSPWFALPSGRRYGREWFVSGLDPEWRPGDYERWRDHEPLLVAQGLQRHLLELQVLDRFVADLLARLDETGLYDRALIVVTADHGVSFRAGGWKRHGTAENLADIASVPLFVKYPGQTRGREDRRAALTIDILPTVADVLGIRLPWSVDGRSLRGQPLRRSVRLGTQVTTDVVGKTEEVAAEVLRVARRNASRFGEGTDSLYRLGPRPELIGRAVDALPRAVADDAELVLPDKDELADVRKSSGFVPAHIVGRLDWSGMRPREELAISVNGRIAAVTTPFHSRGRTLFSALVDELVLRDGVNTVEVYAVRGSGAGTRLIRLGGTESASIAAARRSSSD